MGREYYTRPNSYYHHYYYNHRRWAGAVAGPSPQWRSVAYASLSGNRRFVRTLRRTADSAAGCRCVRMSVLAGKLYAEIPVSRLRESRVSVGISRVMRIRVHHGVFGKIPQFGSDCAYALAHRYHEIRAENSRARKVIPGMKGGWKSRPLGRES